MELNKALKEFFIREPFYGTLMLNFNKQMVGPDHEIKTAAIGRAGLNLTLYVNQKFWNELSDKEQAAILKHEVMHVAFMHLTSLFDVPSNKHYQMNIAEDCAINQYIHNLPGGGITLQKLEEICGKKLESYQGAWYYYNELEKICQKNSGSFQKMIEEMLANGNLSDHSLWPKDMSSAEGKLLENHIKSIIKNTAETCKTVGSIPGELKDIIDSILLKEEVFNWRKYFRRVIGNSIRTFISPTRYRPSKRFPDAQGLKTKSKPEVMVAVDTSGSIGGQELSDFFSEIYHLYKSGVAVTIVEFDTKVQNTWPYKGQIKDIPIHGRGGTCVKDVIRYYKEHRSYSSCIIFTDGYLDVNVEPCQQLIWVISSKGQKQKYPGKVIYIP